MNVMKEIEFEIEGIAPLKMDRFHGLPDPKTPEGYRKQAEEKCYRDEEGNLAIPASALKACMRLASSELGKKTDAKKNRQAIAAGVFFKETMFSLGKKEHDGIVEDLVTRGKGDKVTRVITYRPHIKEWKIGGRMYVMGIPVQFVKQAFELGGIKYGLLGHRPEFGRFIIKKFEVIEDGKKGTR